MSTSITTKKIIAVVGATGKQGGSVARTFLTLSDWHVRALTRNTTSDAAKALAAAGAELVPSELSDTASLRAAFAGAQAIFLNTDFWSTFYPEKARLEAAGQDVTSASQVAFAAETGWGKNAADAAAATPSLERVVVSALPSMKTDGQATRSLHPEAKDWIVQYIAREQPALAEKMSVIYLGAYTNNRMIAPTFKDPASGVHKFVLPLDTDVNLPVIDPENSTGPFVRELIETEAPGTKLFAYDSDLSVGEIVNTWARATGQPAEHVRVSVEDMRKQGALWEHLDAVKFINDHKAGYDSRIPGAIRPPQLKNKVVTKPWEVYLRENYTPQA